MSVSPWESTRPVPSHNQILFHTKESLYIIIDKGNSRKKGPGVVPRFIGFVYGCFLFYSEFSFIFFLAGSEPPNRREALTTFLTYSRSRVPTYSRSLGYPPEANPFMTQKIIVLCLSMTMRNLFITSLFLIIFLILGWQKDLSIMGWMTRKNPSRIPRNYAEEWHCFFEQRLREAAAQKPSLLVSRRGQRG